MGSDRAGGNPGWVALTTRSIGIPGCKEIWQFSIKSVFDFAHLSFQDRGQLKNRSMPVLAVVEHDGLLWISFSKGSSGVATDLNRDQLWEALADQGIRLVSQVSVNEVWSAMRFRPIEAVGN